LCKHYLHLFYDCSEVLGNSTDAQPNAGANDHRVDGFRKVGHRGRGGHTLSLSLASKAQQSAFIGCQFRQSRFAVLAFQYFDGDSQIFNVTSPLCRTIPMQRMSRALAVRWWALVMVAWW